MSPVEKDVGNYVGILRGEGTEQRVHSEQNLLSESAGSTIHEEIEKQQRMFETQLERR